MSAGRQPDPGQVPDDPFIGIPLSVVLALLDGAAADAEMTVEEENYAAIRSYQAVFITLRFLGLHDPGVRDGWLRWQDDTGSAELVAQLRSEAWL